MQQSNMAIVIQNGRPEMFQGLYLRRYSTDNENSSNVYNISKVKKFKPDILLNFGIQYGG